MAMGTVLSGIEGGLPTSILCLKLLMMVGGKTSSSCAFQSPY